MKICKHTCVRLRTIRHSRAEETSIVCDSERQILWKMALQYIR